MNSFIIFTFISLAILNGYFALYFNCRRPPWRHSIDTKFKNQCKDHDQLPNSCKNAHLSHVVSWHSICQTAKDLYNTGNFRNMKKLINDLFKIDPDAQVWTAVGQLSHQAYMGSTNEEKNTEFKTDALAIVRDWKNGLKNDIGTVNTFRSLLNSAPANLRYSVGRQNQGIGKSLDPMGDRNQKMTAKEKEFSFPCKPIKQNTIGCTKCRNRSCDNACRSSSAPNFYVCKQ